MNPKVNATVDFLVRLRRIDKSSITVRDVLVLYTVIQTPGLMGVEIAAKLGLPSRSSIQVGIQRLIREGMIEDRREWALKANPANLHPLQKGIDFWNEIKPD